MKRMLVTSLAMNVARFTPVFKNLHGHNFQSSWRICHSDWKLASDKTKLPDARQKLTEQRENPRASRGVVRSWWKSLLCSRPKSLTFLFGLCPSSLLRKVPRCAASFLMSSAPVVFLENSSFWMLSTKTEIKLVSLKKMQLGW